MNDEKQMTDLDLPLIARTQANYWKAKFLESLRELNNANRGIARLKQRVKRLEEQNHD